MSMMSSEHQITYLGITIDHSNKTTHTHKNKKFTSYTNHFSQRSKIKIFF